MKTIGIVGGMSWESTTLYYQWINREVARSRGGLSSAKMLLHSFDFSEIAELQRCGEWNTLASMLADAARRLEDGGADCVLIATNTMHCVADSVADAITIPLIHIVDAVARAVHACAIGTVGLLGTKFTMEQAFYRERLQNHGIESLVPDPQDRAFVHNVIFDELCKGKFKQSSCAEFVRICDKLRERGAKGIILGCTEIPLLLSQEDLALQLFDTTRLHAKAATRFALESHAEQSLALA